MDSHLPVTAPEPVHPESASIPPSDGAPKPGSAPLRNVKHERFAVARAAMFGFLEAAREAGYESMTAANAAKIDRMPSVRERITFLAGDTAKAVQQLRAKVTTKLNVIRDVSMADFIRMERDPGMVAHLRDRNSPSTIAKLRKTMLALEKSADEIDAAIAALPTDAEIEAAIANLPVLPWPDFTRIATLAPDEQREILSAVKSVAITEQGPRFEIHSPLEAIAQLRKLTGLDAAEKVNVSGGLTLEALVGASYTKPALEKPQAEAAAVE